MKKIHLLFTLALGMIFTACEKDYNNQTAECFRVKIVDQVCNTVVLQILDSNQYALGVNGYEKNGIRYNHVFTTTLNCDDAQAYANRQQIEGGTPTFYVRLESKKREDDCVTCSGTIPNPPQQFHSVVLNNGMSHNKNDSLTHSPHQNTTTRASIMIAHLYRPKY